MTDMPRHIITLIATTLTALLCSCDTDIEYTAPQALVVEGWIDSGDFPVVTLTRSISITSDYQPLDSLEKYMEQWAKVTIDDGERKEVMMGKYDRNYFPPYIYTTSYMRGEPGRTYRLTVDCTDGTHAEAVTTIPRPIGIDSTAIEPVAGNDTLRQLSIFVDDPRTETRYYKVFVHAKNKDKGYRPAYMGLTDSHMLPDDGRISVSQGRTNIVEDFTPNFAVGDTVLVKLAHVDKTAYDFWRSFEDLSDLSRNPFFPMTDNLPSNMHGALGYWFGYGCDKKWVIIK